MMTTRSTHSALVLFASVLMSATAAAAEPTGVITIRDQNEHSCSMPVPPTGSGDTWQYELRSNNTCPNNSALSVAFSGIPSATTIFMSDNDTCTKTLQQNNTFWFELKTVKKLTNTDIINMVHLADFNNKSIVAPGLQLVDKGLFNQVGPIRDRLSCVRISVSSPEPITYNAIAVSPNAEWSEAQKESDHQFNCGGDLMMIGRRNLLGLSYYRCAAVAGGVPGGPYTLTDRESIHFDSERDSYFVCPSNKVATGRNHYGNSDGPTTYQCARLVNGKGETTTQVRGEWSAQQPEDNFSMECPRDQVLVGRSHAGGATGNTVIRCASLFNATTTP